MDENGTGETIEGFDIPKRQLTEEEANSPITWEKIQAFHHEAGEDFLDQVSCINLLIYTGWLVGKYPERSIEILKMGQAKFADVNTFTDLYDDDDEEEKFYTDVAEFLNLTYNAKRRANQVLIQVVEHYRGD
jgi:hypothetical protein